jgi:hypothetical protein
MQRTFSHLVRTRLEAGERSQSALDRPNSSVK